LTICPGTTTVRRTKTLYSDRLTIVPVDSIASIANIIVNIDEPVTIRLLAFHTANNLYCSKLKAENAEKKFCLDIKSRYVHFHFLKDGYPPEKSEFLIAFLPRSKTKNELYQVAKELCDIAEWLGGKQKINCIVFRYGHPVHRMNDLMQWQKQLEKILCETQKNYFIGKIEGRVKDVRVDKCKNITIYNTNLFESINVA
jgi:hypothetical protein